MQILQNITVKTSYYHNFRVDGHSVKGLFNLKQIPQAVFKQAVSKKKERTIKISTKTKPTLLLFR